MTPMYIRVNKSNKLHWVSHIQWHLPDPKAAELFTNDTAQAPMERGVASSATAPPAPVSGPTPAGIP
jgi:hypothetical protein